MFVHKLSVNQTRAACGYSIDIENQLDQLYKRQLQSHIRIEKLSAYCHLNQSIIKCPGSPHTPLKNPQIHM